MPEPSPARVPLRSDFAPDPSRLPLIEFADFSKIDFRLSDATEREQIYRMARGRKIGLLAEKIETEEDMRVARSEDCSRFQGYFFSQPIILSSKAVPQNQVVYLRLLRSAGFWFECGSNKLRV